MTSSTPTIVISGKGRSGSNRALDMLDCSRLTSSRNELNEIVGGEFHGIDGELFDEDLTPSGQAALLAAIERAGRRRSARDPFVRRDKVYLNGLGRLALAPMSKTRLRNIAERIGAMDSANEWNLSSSLLSTEVHRMHTVIKLNSCPAWSRFLITNGHAKILHNIRNPFDYLQSWYNRFIIRKNIGNTSLIKNMHSAESIVNFFGLQKLDLFSKIDERSLVYVEMARWRYINERLYEMRRHSDSYIRVTYAEFEADAVATAEKIYDFARIPFDAAVSSKVADLPNRLFGTPHEQVLDLDLCRKAVAEVLSDSPLNEIL